MLTDFLKQIVPDDAIICLSRSRSQDNATVGRPKLNFNNVFFTPAELEHAEHVVAQWNEKRDTEVYFGVAGYATKASRKKTNVSLLQSLFIDVDLWSEKLAAQPGKHKKDFYLTKAEALRGVKKLMRAVPALPRPMIVDSGRGLHVYFLLDQAIPQARWLPLAEAFRDSVRRHEPKLAGDPVRMCDAASVLRLPGSTNAKEPANKMPVTVLVNGAMRCDYDLLMAALGGAETIGLPLPPDWAKGENSFEVGYQGKREFKDVEPRPVLTGCLQMKHHLETKGAVSEPEWLLACRVYVCLRNGDQIAQKFSNPAFKAAIDRKLKHARTNFDAPSAACKEWPEQSRCDGCEHRGNVLFPCEIAEAATAKRAETEAVSKAVAEAAQVAIQGVSAPALPTGYLTLPAVYEQVTVPQNGLRVTHVPGVFKDRPNETTPLIHGHINVCFTTAEVTKEGEYMMRVHLDVISQRQMTSVSIPVDDLTSDQLDKATRPLRQCGLTFDTETLNKTKALKKMFRLIVEVAAPLVVPWFPNKGWDEEYPYGDRPLTVGARRYLPKGGIEHGVTRRGHVGKREMATENVIESFCDGVPRGTMGGWQQGMSVYNRPNMELAQMLMLSGLANMLLPLVSQAPGGIMLALSGKTGIGKTTLLRFLASMVGSPANSMIPGSSTDNSMVNMLSQAGFLLLAIDDTLKMDAATLSLFLNSVSAGKEKQRLTESAGSWSTQANRPFYSSMIVTTNFDVGSVIGTGGQYDAQMNTDAARSRILEVPARRIVVPEDVSPADWHRHEALVMENFGHALEVFANHVVPRQRAIADELRQAEAIIRAQLRKAAPVAGRGALRFWAKYLACVHTTARVLTIDQPILPWSADNILRAGMALVVETDAEAEHDKQNLIEAMWDLFLNTRNDKYVINFSYRTRMNAVGARSKWDETAIGGQLIKGTPVPGTLSVTLQQPFNWRVILTRVTDLDGSTIRYERTVVVLPRMLEQLVNINSGRAIKASDWSEVYDAFHLNGAVHG